MKTEVLDVKKLKAGMVTLMYIPAKKLYVVLVGSKVTRSFKEFYGLQVAAEHAFELECKRIERLGTLI